MQDPYAILASSIGSSVTVHVLNNERVFGTLLSIDDHGNALLQNWKICADDSSDDDDDDDDDHDNEECNANMNTNGTADENSISGNAIQNKRFRAERETSLRFIRGDQIKAINLEESEAQ